MLAALGCPDEWGWIGMGSERAYNVELGLCLLPRRCAAGKGVILCIVISSLFWTVYHYGSALHARRKLEAQHASAVLKRQFTLSEFYVLTIVAVFAFDALHVSLWKLGVRSGLWRSRHS